MMIVANRKNQEAVAVPVVAQVLKRRKRRRVKRKNIVEIVLVLVQLIVVNGGGGEEIGKIITEDEGDIEVEEAIVAVHIVEDEEEIQRNLSQKSSVEIGCKRNLVYTKIIVVFRTI